MFSVQSQEGILCYKSVFGVISAKQTTIFSTSQSVQTVSTVETECSMPWHREFHGVAQPVSRCGTLCITP